MAALLQAASYKPAEIIFLALGAEGIIMAAPGACIDIHLGLVLYRVFGDDIDDTANCITAVQSTATALDKGTSPVVK